MLNRNISYLVLSDIHLGHKKNNTLKIVSHLDAFIIKNNKLISKCDIIFIAGDTYERLLNTSSVDYVTSIEWLTRLVRYCYKNNIRLRILEGTPSHDWKQVKVLETILEELNIDIDFKYIDTLMIETIDEFGIDILYVPDEWTHSGLDTLKEVKQLLIESNLTKVDLAIMHGQFRYQIPQVELESSHSEEDYLELVRHYIHIGHIHTHSVYDRIISSGSTDRLSHGEEEEKGGIVSFLKVNGDDSFIFIPNELATIFKTIDIDDNLVDIDDALEMIFSKIKIYPKDSHIRIRIGKDNPITKSFSVIKEKLIDFNLTLKLSKDDDISSVNTLKFKDDIEYVSITKDNIIELMLEEIKKHNLTNDEMNMFNKELSSVL